MNTILTLPANRIHSLRVRSLRGAFSPAVAALLLCVVSAGRATDLPVTGNITVTGDGLLGTGVSGATATPGKLDLGASYSNGTTRDKLKVYLYNSGTEQYGFGVGGI